MSYVKSDLAGGPVYCPSRGMGEKPSPLGEDFSMRRRRGLLISPD
jgi:hypothetical protein